MVDILIFLGTLTLIALAFLGLSFIIACFIEKEKRATIFAMLQFIGMMGVLLIYLYLAGPVFSIPPLDFSFSLQDLFWLD